MPARPALALLALGAVLLAGCAAGAEDPASPDTAAATPSAAAPSSAAPSPAPSAAAPSAAPTPVAPAVRVITASYADGEVVTDGVRVESQLGEEVVLRISSDVAEEIHVHGYDVYADIPAGGSVDIPLTLTLPGSYEVELHGAGRPLFQLRTS